jgi:hypothetical protein
MPTMHLLIEDRLPGGMEAAKIPRLAPKEELQSLPPTCKPPTRAVTDSVIIQRFLGIYSHHTEGIGSYIVEARTNPDEWRHQRPAKR